ncbi:MAG: dienelactone hydrolase family protein [Candidatus Kapabacteria bacterium]|jgi:predicted esterase|nr:dienelactone hydrolase family protein [Candidatus Kapabacteria bacterium]
MNTQHRHSADALQSKGAALAEANAVIFFLHGRGGTSEDILTLRQFFTPTQPAYNLAYLAPQATDHTWYPYSFMAPMESNEPGLSSALDVIKTLSESALQHGIPSEKQYFVGFSQGACLMLEYAARNAKRYGGIYAFSGGVIGPEGTPRDYAGNFAGTPVFMGCSDRDPHIPKARFLETVELFSEMGAAVAAQLYPNMPHTIIQDEITQAQELFAASL